MGLLSGLFGSNKNNESKNSTSSRPLTNEELALLMAADEAHEEMEAQRILKEHEWGHYLSWEEAKWKNPHVRNTKMDEVARMSVYDPNEMDRLRP